MKFNNYSIVILTLVYFVISLIGIQHHELWLDESHHWLLARDSSSFLELIKNTRYEGHPILWNILLYQITRFTLNPFWMQFLHILISTTVVFIFLKKAPFNWIFKTLFIFGYFMLFEYNIISRNYILGVLILFLAALSFRNREKNFIKICIYLVIASNIHLMFSVIAFALFLTLLFERYQNKKFDKSMLIGTSLFLLGLILAAIQITPPNDTLFFNRIDQISFHEKFIKGYISLFKGLITIPDFRTIHFWNSNVLVNISKPLASFLGLICYFIPLIFFIKKKKILFFVYLALLGTQVFFFATQLGATRYDGMTYIIIIIALWIENYYNEEGNSKLIDANNSFKLNLLKNILIYSILIVQFFSGIYAYAMDVKHPFCVAKETVEYLNKNKISTQNVLSITCDGTLISPFLEKKVYFLCDNSLQSYCNWNSGCGTEVSNEKIIKMISNFMTYNNNATYVSTFQITDNLQKNIWVKTNDQVMVRFFKKFDNSIIRNADYYIYEIKKIKK
ncbi:MAG: hypothetical protein ACI9FW_000321 [Flavobacterium sp.]|jgi:hypothetical protein